MTRSIWALGLLLGATALPLLFTSPVQAYRGLDPCPDLEPVTPAPPQRSWWRRDDTASRCQGAVAHTARQFVRDLVDAQSSCLERWMSGDLSDPQSNAIKYCVGVFRLDPGEYHAYRGPADAQAATEISDAWLRAEGNVADVCSAEDLAELDLCGHSGAGDFDCVLDDHWEHAQHLMDQLYGEIQVSDSSETRSCQDTIGRLGMDLALHSHAVMVGCLSRWGGFNHGPFGRWWGAREPMDLAERCLGYAADGEIHPPADPFSAFVLDWLERRFDRKVAEACTNEQIATLDACGEDLQSLGGCLRCSQRREAILMIDAEYGGEQRRPTDHFIDWGNLQNPVLDFPDRMFKNQTVGYLNGVFHMFVSQRIESETPGPLPKRAYSFTTRDWKTFEPVPHPNRVAGGSAELFEIGGVWHMTGQGPDPASPFPNGLRTWHSASLDLVNWTPSAIIGANVLPGVAIIDGAVAYWKERWYMIAKNRWSEEPIIARSNWFTIRGGWGPGFRVNLDDGKVGLGLLDGWAENFQLLEIDGQIRLIATARGPEGNRCPSIYNCNHEPYIYTMEHGDGSLFSDWLSWKHKTMLRVPYEAWNQVAHANTGSIMDLREHDGFFYMTYAGGLDTTRFDKRGKNEIGIARSRDLVHWRVAGDLRD